MQSYDVLISGWIANLDIALAEAFTREGAHCLVVRPKEVTFPPPGELPAPLRHFDMSDVLAGAAPSTVLRQCRRVGAIVSMTGTITVLLRQYWYLGTAGVLPPVVNVMTGSDLTELAVASGRAGRVYRALLRRAAFTWAAPYPNALRNLERLRHSEVVFAPFPYLLPEPAPPNPAGQRPIVFLHPAALDWGVNDPGAHRNSTKGSDRFLRAFCRAVRDGADIRCIVVDRGSDRDVARALVGQMGATDRFEWRSPMTQSELQATMAEADVVVDQFDVGGLGAIAAEAMARARPVLVWIDEICAVRMYEAPPPVLNAASEADIERCIWAAATGETDLGALGSAGREWIVRMHGPDATRAVLRKVLDQAR